MEDSAAKDRSSASGRSASRLLRYPLRSAAKPKEEKPPLADSTNSNSAVKRGKGASSVSKSVGVLDLPSKENPAKPPRRLSVPSKSNKSPAPKTIGNITPISETRAKWASGNQGKSDTPLSDVSKSSQRKKFSVLSSSSYWLSQIRLSESAAKHSISLGFFKLALEAGCEPIQRVSDELKLYVRRHNLSELNESVKELFDSYKISENFDEQSQQVLETSSQVPFEGNQLSDNDDVKSSSSSITETEKIKPKPKPKPTALDKNVAGKPHVMKATTETQKKKNHSEQKTRSSARESAANSKTSSKSRGRSPQRKPRKPSKQVSTHDKVHKQGKNSVSCDEGSLNSEPNEALEENKENMDDGAPQMEETNSYVVEV